MSVLLGRNKPRDSWHGLWNVGMLKALCLFRVVCRRVRATRA